MEFSKWWPLHVFFHVACWADPTEPEQSPHSLTSVNPDMMRQSWGHWQTLDISSFVMVELRFHYLIVANINLIKAITESFKKKSVVLVVFPAIQLTPVCTHLKKNVLFCFFCSVCLVSDHLNSVEVGLSASQRIYEKCNFSWIPKELGTQSRNFLAQVTKKRPVIFQHKCKQKDKNYFYSQPNLVAER